MKVEFLNLYKQTSQINTKIYSSIKKNIERSQFINGTDVSLFEREFAKYLNIKYCLGVGNGTDALEIAIKTLRLRKNSEIIVPANTWISTSLSPPRSFQTPTTNSCKHSSTYIQ